MVRTGSTRADGEVHGAVSTSSLIRDMCNDITLLEMVLLETDVSSDALTATRTQVDSILSLRESRCTHTLDSRCGVAKWRLYY